MSQENLRLSVAAQVAVQLVSIGLLAVLAGQELFPDLRVVSDLVRFAAGCALVLVAMDLVAVVRGDFDKLSDDRGETDEPRAHAPTCGAPSRLAHVPRSRHVAAAHCQRFRGPHGT